MLKPFLADLHIHTVLSGCAEVEMIPPLIIQQAKRLGLSLIAITDHNTCSNVDAVIQASRGAGIHVLPGMEVQSREEVHLLCLFDTALQCRKLQEVVFGKLPSLANKEEIFGAQFVVDATGELVRTEERLLAAATDMGLEEVVTEVHSRGGMVIPAHVDRPSFSLLANLGFVPESLDVEALEVTRRFTPATGWERWPELKPWCLIVNGDAHRLQEMENRTLFKIAAPRVEEIRLALKGEQGRRAVVDWPAPCQIS
jgi:predicted metal-dependent phosphoesterase TrpH